MTLRPWDRRKDLTWRYRSAPVIGAVPTSESKSGDKDASPEPDREIRSWKWKSEEWMSRHVRSISPFLCRRESVDSSIAFFFRSDKNAFISLEEENEEDRFGRRKLGGTSLFFRQPGRCRCHFRFLETVPRTERSEDENCVCHSPPEFVMKRNTVLNFEIYIKESIVHQTDSLTS